MVVLCLEPRPQTGSLLVDRNRHLGPNHNSLQLQLPIRVVFNGSPVIDTGGVRRQVFSDVFQHFAENKYVQMFEGPPHFLRPICSAESRSSGMLKVLGTMIAHTIAQDGLGFPYLSPLCYWYLVAGEERALDHLTLVDVGADVRSLVSKVCNIVFGDLPHVKHVLLHVDVM